MTTFLENLWNNILSREAELICEQYEALSEIDQATVWEHLNKMANEEGWHPEQMKSATIAIEALKDRFGLVND